MTTPVYDSVAFLASDTFAVFNAAGDSFVSAFAPGLRLRADCGTDGVLFGTVASSSHDAETGRTVVATAMDGGAALTANLAEVLHGNDVPESLCAHAALHALGGRDALPAASTGVPGLVALANAAETRAGAEAAKAVTPAGLAAAVKGLITTNTTIYVATTGNDTSGDGSSAAPYASIAKALSSIANKLIASGAVVTIQVADGTYYSNSTITIDHPDADKTQILGNTSTETTVPIASIDTLAQTLTIVGNYLSNADGAKNIQPGDIIGLTGSSTSGLNGAYLVSGVSFDGTNTIIACLAEAIASATVGGGVAVIKPCNRVQLNFASGVHGVTFAVPTTFKNLKGLRLNSLGGSSRGLYAPRAAAANVGGQLIFHGWAVGVYAASQTIFDLTTAYFYGCTTAVLGYMSKANLYTGCVISKCTTGINAQRGSYIFSNSTVFRANTTDTSPALNTAGFNGQSYITTS
ncbi:hypothetical protein [Solidesulfovibrio magneticus]|nr:hypothetical protein [Solidesulfovibrio magneticus]